MGMDYLKHPDLRKYQKLKMKNILGRNANVKISMSKKSTMNLNYMNQNDDESVQYIVDTEFT
jgi:hypothetical protein